MYLPDVCVVCLSILPGDNNDGKLQKKNKQTKKKNTFDDAPYQARIAEEQESQTFIKGIKVPVSSSLLLRRRPHHHLQKKSQWDELKAWGAQQSGGDVRPQQNPFKSWKCHKYFGIGHKM